MPFSFTISIDERIKPPDATVTDIAGEDISLERGDFNVTANGDIGTITGVKCARQSAVREVIANPGSFPRRAQWGGGLTGMLFKGNSVANRDRIQSRAKARLQVNPRLTKVHEVSVTATDDGTRLYIRADAVGGPLESVTVIKPPGVY